jgi:hypothetical protein
MQSARQSAAVELLREGSRVLLAADGVARADGNAEQEPEREEQHPRDLWQQLRLDRE